MAMLFAAASIQNNNGTIFFVGAVDEEGNATGIKNLVKKEMGIDYAVFGEPSGIKQVTIAYKGRLAINLKISVNDRLSCKCTMAFKKRNSRINDFCKRIKGQIRKKPRG